MHLAAGDRQEARPVLARDVAHLPVVGQHQEVVSRVPVRREPVSDGESSVRFGAMTVSIAPEPAPGRPEWVHRSHSSSPPPSRLRSWANRSTC